MNSSWSVDWVTYWLMVLDCMLLRSYISATLFQIIVTYIPNGRQYTANNLTSYLKKKCWYCKLEGIYCISTVALVLL